MGFYHHSCNNTIQANDEIKGFTLLCIPDSYSGGKAGGG